MQACRDGSSRPAFTAFTACIAYIACIACIACTACTDGTNGRDCGDLLRMLTCPPTSAARVHAVAGSAGSASA